MLSMEWLAGFGIMLAGWGTRLQLQVNRQSVQLEEREKQADDRHDDMVARLERIERKIDANGKNHAN